MWIGIIITTIVLFLFTFSNKKTLKPNEYYKVYLDGEVLGTIKSKNEIDNYINSQGTSIKENVKKAFTENFSGVEVTGCALGLTKMSCYMGNIFESARYKKMNDSKYDVFLGEWEMHSLAIFDTDCIDVVEEKTINTKLRDHDDNEERY